MEEPAWIYKQESATCMQLKQMKPAQEMSHSHEVSESASSTPAIDIVLLVIKLLSIHLGASFSVNPSWAGVYEVSTKCWVYTLYKVNCCLASYLITTTV